MIPFSVGVGMSVFRHVDGAWSFAGLAHFAEILSPAAAGRLHFYRTLAVTILWTASNVALHLTIGLGLALLLGGSCSPSAVSSAQPAQQAQVPQPAQFAAILIPSPTMEHATATATFAAG